MPILNINDKTELKRYNDFIKKQDFVSFMQANEWGEVKYPNWEQKIIYLEDNNDIVASMAILIRKFSVFTLFYVPRGPIVDLYNIKLVNKLIDEVNELAKQNKAFVLKMDPQVKYNEKLYNLYKNKGFKITKKNANSDNLIQPKHNAVLYIKNKTEEELLESFSQKTRYNVRLAAKKGVTVRYSHDLEDLKKFYQLYKTTTVRDKIGCREITYFEKMLNSYPKDKIRIYIAEFEGEPLSAAISTNYGKELFYVYGASSNEKRNLMPNYLMQWEMIKWGLEEKCSLYNFGGLLHLDSDNGLYRFKTGFCGEEGIEEYIGEIDKVYNKFGYFLFSKAVPVFKKIVKKFRKYDKN